jgi:hypothetical protein
MGGIRPKTAAMKKRRVRLKVARRRKRQTPHTLGIDPAINLKRQRRRQDHPS